MEISTIKEFTFADWFQTLKGNIFPRVLWRPLRAAVTETGVDRTAWMAAETVCSSW